MQLVMFLRARCWLVGAFAVHIHRAAKLRLLNFLSLFRDLQEPTLFSGGGGGVVAPFSRDLQLRNQIFTQH